MKEYSMNVSTPTLAIEYMYENWEPTGRIRPALYPIHVVHILWFNLGESSKAPEYEIVFLKKWSYIMLKLC